MELPAFIVHAPPYVFTLAFLFDTIIFNTKYHTIKLNSISDSPQYVPFQKFTFEFEHVHVLAKQTKFVLMAHSLTVEQVPRNADFFSSDFLKKNI